MGDEIFVVKKIENIVPWTYVISDFDKRLTLKNNALFVSCISKINGELVENAEDLDILIPMYNLLKYSKNYEKTSGSLLIIIETSQMKLNYLMTMVQ